MTDKHIGLFKGRGQFTSKMVPVQAMIPVEIDEAVAKVAKEAGLSKATYWRRWIIESFKKAQAKGEV